MRVLAFNDDCSTVSNDVREGASSALRILKEHGCTFLVLADSPKIAKQPERNIDSNGNIILPVGLEHHLLTKSSLAVENNRPHGSCSLGYIQQGRRVRFSQRFDECDSVTSAEPAQGLLSLTLDLYPIFRPSYCYLDQMGEEHGEHDTLQHDLRFLYWANIFGPLYVEKLGRRFLMNAPSWKTEELDDRGILYVLDESFYRWTATPTPGIGEEAIAYFRKQVPEITCYRATPVGLPHEIGRMVVTDESGEENIVYERPAKPTKKSKSGAKPRKKRK